MTPRDFIAKWQDGGGERRDAQPFFEDLCRLVGHPTLREADPEHSWFIYEYIAAYLYNASGVAGAAARRVRQRGDRRLRLGTGRCPTMNCCAGCSR